MTSLCNDGRTDCSIYRALLDLTFASKKDLQVNPEVSL